jgi:hypothetical protein
VALITGKNFRRSDFNHNPSSLFVRDLRFMYYKNHKIGAAFSPP